MNHNIKTSGKIFGIIEGVIPNLRSVFTACYQSTDDPQVPPGPNQMAIKLLQLNRLELQDVLTQELVENPLLEEVDENQESESTETEEEEEGIRQQLKRLREQQQQLADLLCGRA